MKDVTAFAHELLASVIGKEDLVVDATCGNGHDTLFLANRAQRVHAFDIQKSAIDATKKRLDGHGVNNVTLHHMSHEHMHGVVKGPIKAVAFNLGYLPGSTKKRTTHGKSTWNAIQSILPKLSLGGIIVCVVYVGHPEGKREGLYLDQALSQLNHSVLVTKHALLNKPLAPYVLRIEKRRDSNA